jgi:thioredoxin 1
MGYMVPVNAYRCPDRRPFTERNLEQTENTEIVVSRNVPANSEPCGGAHAATRHAMILLILCLVGCTKTSKELAIKVPSTPADTALGLPKLVDLGATACVPCKKMAPILEELETEYAGVLDVSFLDVWKPVNKVVAEFYRVEEIPTQIFLDPEGKELWRHDGFLAKADILAKWEELGYELKPREKVETPHDVRNATSPFEEDENEAATTDGSG